VGWAYQSTHGDRKMTPYKIKQRWGEKVLDKMYDIMLDTPVDELIDEIFMLMSEEDTNKFAQYIKENYEEEEENEE
jgi:hypothetical protein